MSNIELVKNEQLTKHQSQVSDFRFLKQLGAGSYSKVFKVLRKEDNKIYSLK